MRTINAPVVLIMDPAGDAAPTAQQLRTRYGATYTVEVFADAGSASQALADLASVDARVVLVLAVLDDDGPSVLEDARTTHPHARRGLLLDWNGTRARREEIAATFSRRLAEGFVTKPMDTVDERFHRNVTELLDEWWRQQGSPSPVVRVVGNERSARVHEIVDLLQRHDIPAVFQPVDAAEASAIVGADGSDAGDLPLVALRDGRLLSDPSNVEISEALGGRTRPGSGLYDLVIVGGGPAGLSAAVYAGSEGLRTALVEPTAMGGQAGTSSMIRNFLGFPRGISGAELAARAFEQAILFGTEMIYGNAASGLRIEDDRRVIELAGGGEVTGRSVIVATGVSYRTLDVPSLEPFAGLGVYYGAAMSEAPSMTGEDLFVVGGGNSAGQAALHLARFARRVTMLVRGESLADSMSSYLLTEIDATPNIDIRYRTEVHAGDGARRLETLDIRDRQTGAVTTHKAAGLFVLIGGAPHTQWLPKELLRDRWGYLETGPTTSKPQRRLYESTVPGVFAVGDARRDSIKRVASAVGEGAVCVRLVHEHLAETPEPIPT